MSLTAINIENLEYFYRSAWTGRKIRALNPYSLKVQSGDCFGFLGNNGAGKTTTIKSILSIIKPYRGNISIFGISSKDPQSRQSVGYVTEQPYFYEYLSVEETISMYAGLSSVPYKNRKKAVSEAIAKVGLNHKIKSSIRSLSKGLTQRVAIAQAICHKPKLLILDEPFSGLDPVGRKEIRDLFADLKDKGTTIFICSHILSDVESLCNRVAIMSKGELKGCFDLEKSRKISPKGYELTFSSDQQIDQRIVRDLGGKVLSHPGLLRVVFEDQKNAQIAIKKAFEHSLNLESFEPAYTSLEDLYLSLVGN